MSKEQSTEATEIAKATQEVAKAAGKAIDAGSGVGRFVERVFGDLVENAVGIVSDRVKFYRQERLASLQEKVERRLADAGVTETRNVAPKIAVPLLERATVEDEDALHSRWANLLANAMDPNYAGEMKRSFVSILGEFEAMDAKVLDELYKAKMAPQNRAPGTLFQKAKIAAFLNISEDKCELSLRNLMRLGCVKPGVITGGASVGGHALSSYKDTEIVDITPSGIELVQAITRDNAQKTAPSSQA